MNILTILKNIFLKALNGCFYPFSTELLNRTKSIEEQLITQCSSVGLSTKIQEKGFPEELRAFKKRKN